MYQIKRFYAADKPAKNICQYATLEEAKKHCNDPKTEKRDKNGNAIWFDAYELI